MNKFLLAVLLAFLLFSLGNAQDQELMMDMSAEERAALIQTEPEIEIWQSMKPTVDRSPNSSQVHHGNFLDAPFDMQLSWDLSISTGANGNAGSEFDGTYYYTTRWASNLLHKHDMSGTLVEEFSIPGVSGLRDLAFDGTYMYGGAAANTIYQMDFTTKTLIGTISSPVAVRNIAYDPRFDAFWVGNWDTPIALVDRSGTQIASLPNTLIAKYGSAYDDWTPGGPYLWVFNQDNTTGGSPQYIHQFDLNTLTPTGFTYDVWPDVPSGATAIAGGLFTSEGIVAGTASIGGVMQGVPDYFFVYELAQAGDTLDPKPPTNFSAYSDYTTPTSMLLNWSDPTEYVNGDPLTNFQIIIARDTVIVDSVNMGTETYTDLGPLTDGQSYTYDIWAKDLNDSSGASATTSWIAGGSPIPDPPAAFSLTNAGGGDLMAHWTNPSTNVDGTPMDDFDAINIYENSILLTTFTRSPGDTGAADSAVFTPGGANLPYYVTAVDNESPPNESVGSNTAYPPFSAPYAQDFETGGVMPVQWTNETDDDFDWTLDAGGTTSSGTGPTVDHTTGTTAGYYMYTESSTPNFPNMIAHLTTPFIDLSTVTQPGMAFWYHMHGAAMGELHVDVYANGVWNLDAMTPLIGQQQPNQTDPWLQAVIDLSPYVGAPIQVRFRGITGTSFTSDMAIDDVFFGSLASNPQMVVAPQSIDDTLLVGGTRDYSVLVSNISALPTVLNYTVTEDPAVSWLNVVPTSGAVTSGQSDTLNVTLDATGLSSGSYNTQLIVSGDDTTNSADTVTVSLEVNDAPAIAVAPDTFDVSIASGNTLDTTMTIYNTGVGPLDFELAVGGALPEIIYYKFDEAGSNTTQNFAAPGSPAPPTASVLGLTMGGTGYDGSALIGNGGSSSSNYVDTGWITNLGSGDWTISLWLNNVDNSTTLYYHFGDNTATSFRAFTGGVAGAGNLLLRGPVTDVLVTGVAPGPSVVDYVYDSAAGEVRAYLNGVLNNTVAQTGVNIVGTAPFKVGGYSTSAGMASGELMDEFKIFNQAVDPGTRGTQAFWLSADTTSGTVAPGDSMQITLTFDPTGLLGGDHETEILVLSNDPINPEVSVGVHMFVIAEPNVGFNPDPVTFDTTFTTDTSDVSAHVLNSGAGQLDVTNITITNPVFGVDQTSFIVPPLDSFEVTLSFTPTSAGSQTGWMIIASNDPDTPLDSIALSGEAVDAPVANITPNFTNPVPVQPGDSTDVTISIINAVGAQGANLEWSASVANAPATSKASLPAPSQSGIAVENPDLDRSPHTTSIQHGNLIDAPFDMQLSWDLFISTGANGNAGSEFDGTYFYTTRWASNLLHKHDMSGTLVEEFSIPGVTGLRDLAFDGTYMYGGNAANTIYQMDFTTKTLIGTISSPVAVRNIAYDPRFDAFWVGNWDTPIALVDRSGTQIASLPNTLIAKYGSAYDDWTPGGPYLWVFNQDNTTGGSPQYIHQFDLNTFTPTGFTHDVWPDVPSGATAIAGGLFTSEGIVPGTVSIGGVMQGVPDYFFVYELAPSAPPWISLIGTTGGSLDPGDQYDLTVRVDDTDTTSTDTAYVVIHTNDPNLMVVNILVVRDVITGITEVEQLPMTYAVYQNYPNPFNPTTTFKYQLPEVADVKLVIYNVLGQKVRTLINRRIEPGYHSEVWNGLNDSGRQVATGVYIYRFEAGNYARTLKMLMLK